MQILTHTDVVENCYFLEIRSEGGIRFFVSFFASYTKKKTATTTKKQKKNARGRSNLYTISLHFNYKKNVQKKEKWGGVQKWQLGGAGSSKTREAKRIYTSEKHGGSTFTG
eukprot:GEMP01075262.1.p2 GENE.GEMP01075262.1~~GEMP01075262.1.p2  ORF type:complete len:111 (-),score=7.43 GEMP01075262.1:430-762(-)